MLVTSIFSFSHNVFHPLTDNILATFDMLPSVCAFRLNKSNILSFRKQLLIFIVLEKLSWFSSKFFYAHTLCLSQQSAFSDLLVLTTSASTISYPLCLRLSYSGEPCNSEIRFFCLPLHCMTNFQNFQY